MRKTTLIIIYLFFFFGHYAQVSLINTGTDTWLQSIFIGNNIMVNGVGSYLVKSYDECNSLISVDVPTRVRQVLKTPWRI